MVHSSIHGLGQRLCLRFVHPYDRIIVVIRLSEEETGQGQTGHTQHDPHPAPQQQRQVVSPFEQHVGVPDEQCRHHTRVFVRQKMAVKNSLARVIFVLNPNSSPTVWWNDDRVPPDLGIEAHHLSEGGIIVRRELRTHFLDLEAVHVDVERMDVMVCINQYVFDSLVWVGVEIQTVLSEGFSVYEVLGKWRCVSVCSHRKNDGFGFGDLVRLYGLGRRIARGKHHGFDVFVRQSRSRTLVRDTNLRQELIVGMPVHVEELHALNALLRYYVPPGFVEAQKNLLALSTGHHDRGLSTGMIVGHPVAGNDPEGKTRFLPVVLRIIHLAIVIIRSLIDNEGVFILDRPAQNTQVQDLSDAHIVKAWGDFPVDQKGMDLRESSLAVQELIDLDVMIGMGPEFADVLKGWIPDHEIAGIDDPVLGKLVHQRAFHLDEAHHSPPQLDGR
mmetsp:Transcript_15938/g.36908  ORF Transcript_15938/g.36908 Transcript_15938/m.36908 type:complete len:443 (-) Transcript_15938:1150-2478(-)